VGEPSFPKPTTRAEREQTPAVGVYRLAAAPSARPASAAPSPRAVDVATNPSVAVVAAELQRARSTMRLGGLALVVGGLALAGVALALGVSSGGRAIPIGLVGAGVLLVARGLERILRSLLASH